MYLFPQSVKMKYFCSSPFSADPICPQPNEVTQAPLASHSSHINGSTPNKYLRQNMKIAAAPLVLTPFVRNKKERAKNILILTMLLLLLLIIIVMMITIVQLLPIFIVLMSNTNTIISVDYYNPNTITVIHIKQLQL